MRNMMNDSNNSYIGMRLVLAAAILALAIGCQVANSGTESVAYVRGELDANLTSPFPAVVIATERALSQLQFAPVKETKDSLTSHTIARTPAGRKVHITLTNDASNLTGVQIRIGIFGDEGESRAVLEKIRANL
jgi:hypothetical protein